MGNAAFRTETFIVKLWNEAADEPSAEPVWRGSVEHVQSRQVRYFLSFDRLVAILVERIGSPMQPGA
jgi:hypothetical protein